MEFTEDYISFPMFMTKKDNDNVGLTQIKIAPKYILGWYRYDENITTVFVSGIGAISIDCNIEDFETKINDFVGEPVTDSEKVLAIQQRVLDKLNEP